MYEREEKKNIALPQFDFIVLEVYAGVSGYDGESVSFWSSRAKDTRIEPLTVYASNHDSPIAKGIYKQIKDTMPKGAKYTKFVKAYCLQTKSTVEIVLSAMVEAAMQKAIAATESSEKKRSEWDRVFILSLADNDHLWGFHLTGHTTTDIKGNEYAGDGDLFFSPVFQAGIVDPQKRPDLHKTCVEAQSAERTLHEAYKAKYASETVQPETPEKFPIEYAFSGNGERALNTNVTASPAANTFPTTNETNPALAAGFPDTEPADGNADDLPF